MTSDEIKQLKVAIVALEAQRPVLGDAVVETALAPLREKLSALTRAAPEVDERKRITILFSDLAGFTATSETMDAEEVYNIMDVYFAHWNTCQFQVTEGNPCVRVRWIAEASSQITSPDGHTLAAVHHLRDADSLVEVSVRIRSHLDGATETGAQ